ncbi:MAG: NADH-quinone oxidoreductase subunit L [Planctomycetes bacterium]|nr:NADH-quinone oxidoreductase subunit L [Planctomycetota bacterium]
MDLTFHPETDFKLLLAVPLIPLCGYVIQIFFGRFLPRKGDWLLTGGMFVTMCLTLYMFAKALHHAYGGGGHGDEHGEHEAVRGFFHHSSEAGMTWSWLFRSSEGGLPTPALNLTVGILYDGLGAAMLAVVGVVSFFVHLFSSGYMQGDRRYHIFFANISLFTVAMLGLVLSDNILFLFVFWEIMGLMSYLLIGHLSQDPHSHRINHAAAACKKAFLTTRIGDCCLFIGFMMFYYHYQSFGFTELWARVTGDVATHGWQSWHTVAGLFLFGGTVGKSAQFPLHIWLPDAMEGPTPVSAMIHAATMVAAGVFLLGRLYPLMSPDVLAVVTAVGAFTAIFAATIGMTVFDIKGVLAYSTISQLGFMVAAIGTGGIGLVAGLWHMVTHAFFKACLFLSAGSVIHGCHHEQDMRKMGGLRKKMPITFACMLICTLAISGIPLFSGFYSKDKIVMASFLSLGHEFSGAAAWASFALPAAAAITAFYMFRLIYMTFFGEPRDHHVHDHAHESPWPMTVSLMGLALLGIFSGHFWLNGDLLGAHGTWWEKLVVNEHNLADLSKMYGGVHLQNTYGGVATMDPHGHVAHSAHVWAMGISSAVALLGIALSTWIYLLKKLDPARVTNALGEVYTTVANKYYIDEFVQVSFIKGAVLVAAGLKWFDETIIDGLVLLVGRINKGVGFVAAWFDKTVVDGLVNAVGAVSNAFGSALRLLQTGRIQQYVSFAVAGGLLAAAWLILS